MKIITKITDFLTKNKKNIIYILWFLVIFSFLSDVTFATTEWNSWWTWNSTTVTDGNKTSKDWSAIINWLNEFLKAVAIVLTVGTNIVWWFLYPEWTSWKIIWIDGILKTIWIMVSNVVYFIFAWVFIWIAFMNIIWQEWENYQLKQALPKFIVWVLIVPFSWFFVQFVLSMSSILTAAVLSLPMTDGIYNAWENNKTSQQIDVCANGYTIYTWTDESLKKSTAWQKVSAKWSWYVVVCEWWKVKKDLAEFLKWKWIYSVMYYYTFSVMKFDSYWKVFSQDVIAWGIRDILALIFKTWFSLIFIVIYAILIITLWIALFVRWIWFWIFAMLSPVFWLLHFFNHGHGWWDGHGNPLQKLSIKNLISLWMVPVYVSAALAFWIIFINTAWSWIAKNELIKTDWKRIVMQAPWQTDSSTQIGWPNAYLDDKSKSTTWQIVDAFQTSFWTLVMQIFGIVFLWMWVMAALHSSEITKEVTEPVSHFWEEVWKLLKKSPTYAPIFPGGLSAQGLQTIWWQASSYYQNKASTNAQDWLKDKWLFTNHEVEKDNNAKQSNNRLRANMWVKNNQSDAIEKLRAYDNIRDFKDSNEARALATTLAEALWVAKDKIKFSSDAEIKAAFEAMRQKDIEWWNVLWIWKMFDWEWNFENKFFTWWKSKWWQAETPTTTLPSSIKEETTLNWKNVNIYNFDVDAKNPWSNKAQPIFIPDSWKLDTTQIKQIVEEFVDKKYAWKYWEWEFIDLLQKLWIKEWITDVISWIKWKDKDFFNKKS